MKKIITAAFFLLAVVSFVFGHSHSYYKTAYSTETNSFSTYDGARVRLAPKPSSSFMGNVASESFNYTFYGLGSGSSLSDQAWSSYVNSGYRLIYMGGNYYISDSDSWSENGNISSYLYPSYLDYLRP